MQPGRLDKLGLNDGIKGDRMWGGALESFFSCPEIELSCGTHGWYSSAPDPASIGTHKASDLELS